MKPLIKINGLTKIYKNKKKFNKAIDNFTLNIFQDDFVSIVGPSGCGKSTLLNILAGFITYEFGEVLFKNRPIIKPSNERAVVFQDDAVFPWMTVSQNISYGPSVNKISRNEKKIIVKKYLRLVGLEKVADYYPKQLSGGMKKRVDLARAYANNPSVLLMDEPFGSLDVFTRRDMQLKLLELLEVDKKTVVFITHDISEAILLSNRIVVMSPQPGTVSEVFDIPFSGKRNHGFERSNLFLNIKNKIEQLIKNE